MKQRVLCTLCVVATSLLGLFPVPRADAVLNPGPSGVGWAAYIEMKKGYFSESHCSGALVAPQWVLTAAHCVAELSENGNDYRVMAAKNVNVYLGRTSGQGSQRGTKYAVDRIETRRYRVLPNPGRNDDDVALLHLAKRSSIQPLWLLPGPSLAKDGLAVTLHGYGWTVPDGTPNGRDTGGVLRATKPGSSHLATGCPGATDGLVCVDATEVDGGFSLGGPADSGAQWVRDVDGRDVGVLVFSGYTSDDFAFGESVYNDLTLEWIRSYAGIPAAVAGRVVRDPSSGDSWLVDNDGFRRPIPDGGTYECLVGRGADVVNLPGESLALMPARTIDATCGSEGGGSGILLLTIEEEGGDGAAAQEILNSLGYQTTLAADLPTDLSAYDQIWVFTTYYGYSDEVRVALGGYVAGGGSLLANGEWVCCPVTNSTLETLMTSVLNIDMSVGPTSRGIEAPLAFNGGAVDGISAVPNVDPSLLVSAHGEQVNVPQENQLVVNDGIVLATAWLERNMLSGTGRLVTIMDSNWSDASRIAPNEQAIENIAAFLERG